MLVLLCIFPPGFAYVDSQIRSSNLRNEYLELRKLINLGGTILGCYVSRKPTNPRP